MTETSIPSSAGPDDAPLAPADPEGQKLTPDEVARLDGPLLPDLIIELANSLRFFAGPSELTDRAESAVAALEAQSGQVQQLQIMNRALERSDSAARAELAELQRKADRNMGMATGFERDLRAARTTIAEALAEHGHADTCGSMLNEVYPCNGWRSVLSGSSQGAAEPSDILIEDVHAADQKRYAAEPWTDPKPHLDNESTQRYEYPNSHSRHIPHTRAQYEAEEGNR